MHATLDLAWTAVSENAITLSKPDDTLDQVFTFILTAVAPPLIGVGGTYLIKESNPRDVAADLDATNRKVSQANCMKIHH